MKDVISVDELLASLESYWHEALTPKEIMLINADLRELKTSLHSLLISKLPKGYLECTKYPGTSTRCNKCNACNRMDDKDFEDGMEYYKNIVERVIDEMFEVKG